MIGRTQLLRVSRSGTLCAQLKPALFSTVPAVDKPEKIGSDEAIKNTNYDNIKAELVKTFKTLLDSRKTSAQSRQTTKYNEMFGRQLALEEEQFDLAVQDYVDIQSGLMAMGRGTSLKSVQKTMVSWYEPLCTLIEQEVSSYSSDQKKIESEVLLLFVITLC